MNSENKIALTMSILLIIWMSLTAILLQYLGLGYDFITFHIPMVASAVIFMLIFMVFVPGCLEEMDSE